MKTRKVIVNSIGFILLLFIIVAIFLPNLIASRRHAPVMLSCNKMAEIVQAEYAYNDKNSGKYGTLEQLEEANLIDKRTSAGESFGYRFSLIVNKDSFSLDAVPINYEAFIGFIPSSYYADDKGIIWGNEEKGKRPSTGDSIMLCEGGKYGYGVCGTKYTKEECYEEYKVKRKQ